MFPLKLLELPVTITIHNKLSKKVRFAYIIQYKSLSDLYDVSLSAYEQETVLQFPFKVHMESFNLTDTGYH